LLETRLALTGQRTIKRYFDPTIPSAEVKPTQISKVGDTGGFPTKLTGR
jgi:hypothetical protein